MRTLSFARARAHAILIQAFFMDEYDLSREGLGLPSEAACVANDSDGLSYVLTSLIICAGLKCSQSKYVPRFDGLNDVNVRNVWHSAHDVCCSA
jgi:hypothetical protein